MFNQDSLIRNSLAQEECAINVWKVPKGETPEKWARTVSVILCESYGLLQRSKNLLYDIVRNEQRKAGIWDVDRTKPGWEEEVSELSSAVCFESIYENLVEKAGKEWFKCELRELSEDSYDRSKTSVNTLGYYHMLRLLSDFVGDGTKARNFGGPSGFAMDEVGNFETVASLAGYAEPEFCSFLIHLRNEI